MSAALDEDRASADSVGAVGASEGADGLPGHPITWEEYGWIIPHGSTASVTMYAVGLPDQNCIVLFATKREAKLAGLGKPLWCSIHGGIVKFDRPIYAMKISDGNVRWCASNDRDGLEWHRDFYYKGEEIMTAVAREFPDANRDKAVVHEEGEDLEKSEIGVALQRC